MNQVKWPSEFNCALNPAYSDLVTEFVCKLNEDEIISTQILEYSVKDAKRDPYSPTMFLQHLNFQTYLINKKSR